MCWVTPTNILVMSQGRLKAFISYFLGDGKKATMDGMADTNSKHGKQVDSGCSMACRVSMLAGWAGRLGRCDER